MVLLTKNVRKPRVQLYLVLVKVLVQLLRPQHLSNAHQLVIVVMAVQNTN